MNVLVLMAGPSDAFHEAGFGYPKNLVEIEGLPLVERVLEPLKGLVGKGSKLICLIRQQEDRQFHTGDVIRLIDPNAVVLQAAETAGAACSALIAIEHIQNDRPLLIVNGDQIIDADLKAITEGFSSVGLDGGIVVFEAVHPRWSYVKVDADNLVVEAAEKRPISNLATAGAYYFTKGSDFVRACMNMIRKNAEVGGRFYICPSYNELVLEQKRIGVHKIDRELYHSLATPQGVAMYEAALREHHREDHHAG